MGHPEPADSLPDENAPDPASSSRADWLCGPEEGIEAEVRRRERESGQLPAPKLFRPGGPPAEDDAPAGSAQDSKPFLQRPKLVPPPESAPPATPPRPAGVGRVQADATDDGISRGPGMIWEPGANSVPKLARTPARPAPAAFTPAPSALDFPMDDAEERARASAVAAAAAAAAAERASQPHTVVTPDAFDLTHAPVPWWMQIPQLLREDRRVQALAGFVVVFLLAVALWPRGEKSLSLGAIKRDPQRFDGQSVKVSGRVGEIFPVGGGFAYYLHQGRDTLVIFTRGVSPRRGQNRTVAGTMSTGYFNGQSGTALFESSAP